MATKDFMSLMKEKTTDLKPSLLSAEQHVKSQLLVLEELRELIPPLTDEVLALLEHNILTHGIRDPLTLWETTSHSVGIDLSTESKPVYVLLDGHNRYQLSQKHKLDFRISVLQFESLSEVKKYMINLQLGRRNLTPEQISFLRGKHYQQLKTERGSNLNTDLAPINVAETLAKTYKVSSRTIKRDGEFAADLETLPTELKREILAGNQKVPKSKIKAIAQDDLTKHLPAINPQDVDQLSITTTADQHVDTLKQEIRKLANSSLNRRSCSLLLKKTSELLAFQSSKGQNVPS